MATHSGVCKGLVQALPAGAPGRMLARGEEGDPCLELRAGGGQGAAAELAWLLSRPWCGGEGVSLSEGQSLYSRFQLFSDGS